MTFNPLKEKGIPLEVNLGAMAAIKAGRNQLLPDGSYPYPVSDFWKVAQEKGCSVVIGYDAHTPKQLLDRGLEEEANGVKLMKEIPDLNEQLDEAIEHEVFGTTMRSVIYSYNEQAYNKLYLATAKNKSNFSINFFLNNACGKDNN